MQDPGLRPLRVGHDGVVERQGRAEGGLIVHGQLPHNQFVVPAVSGDGDALVSQSVWGIQR